MALIDLHTHSNASDGELSPSALVELAARSGLAAVALTDHDTLGGLDEALEAGRVHGVEVIPGCEFSVVDAGKELHLLGLWTSPDAPELVEVLETQRERREERNRLIVDNLRRMGIGLDYDEVAARAGGTVGRPHIAAILVERRLVKSFDAAFRKYLGRHGSAYAPKRDLPMQEAVEALAAAGATVAMAHPYLLGEHGRPLEERARRYKEMGVDAIEAHYTDHSPTRTREYLALAQRLDLGVCGGSDFHGSVKPLIKLGTGKGSLNVTEPVLEALKERRTRQGLWT